MKDRSPQTKVILLLLLLGGLAVSLAAYWTFFTEPAPTWLVKHRIDKYLESESGKSDFSIPFEFPSKAEMAHSTTAGGNTFVPKGILTQKGFDVLRDEYLDLKLEQIAQSRRLKEKRAELEKEQNRLDAQEKKAAARLARMKTDADKASSIPTNVVNLQKAVVSLEQEIGALERALAAGEEALKPVQSDLLDFQKMMAEEIQAAGLPDTNDCAVAQARLAQETQTRLEEAVTYSQIYTLIGQELWVADRLGKSQNLKHQAAALNIARRARTDALEFAEDGWLAARICEAYFWPHLSVAAQSDRRSRLSPERLLSESSEAFRQAEEPQNLVYGFLALIQQADQPRQADWARSQIARIFISMGDFKQALRYLKKIELTKEFERDLRRIPWLEERIKNQP